MAIVTQVNLLKYRRTKIVATVGPASMQRPVIDQLIEAGVNVFRLNMSHGDHKGHEAVYKVIRQSATAHAAPVAILADLCGPKIRTGRFPDGPVVLEKNTMVTVTTREIAGSSSLIPCQYLDLHNDVSKDDRILLADGLIELRVLQVQGTEISCRVIHGGALSDHKGINLPGVNVSAPSLTDKDRRDAQFAVDLGVDFIAMSFVRSAADMDRLRDIVAPHDERIQLIAKIEKPEALQNAEEIIDSSDCIMVARGDLGVELSPEEVPAAQDALIQMATEKGKPVIVATQMLESMITSARPTRAEVTDVSHAVVSAADAVMLSGETAVGEHPVDAVRTMDRIARQTEAHLSERRVYGRVKDQLEPPLPIWSVIANATSNMSKDLNAKAVMVISRSGASATTVSTARPAAPIVAITGNDKLYRTMSLLWGVIPVYLVEAGKENPNELTRQVTQQLGLASPGESVLLVRGFHENPKLNLPSVTVITV
jgi:pyruvate kinase